MYIIQSGCLKSKSFQSCFFNGFTFTFYSERLWNGSQAKPILVLWSCLYPLPSPSPALSLFTHTHTRTLSLPSYSHSILSHFQSLSFPSLSPSLSHARIHTQTHTLNILPPSLSFSHSLSLSLSNSHSSTLLHTNSRFLHFSFSLYPSLPHYHKCRACARVSAIRWKVN